MQIKKKLIKSIKLYIIFFHFILFINIFFISNVKASLFEISNLNISEPFDINFNKGKVIDKGFRKAFIELISMITTSGDKEKILSTPLSEIKGLIDSFTMEDEKFINNQYQVKFDVNFNKKNTLIFFEKKSIFPALPKKKKLLIIPVLVNLQKDEILLFNNNIFYEKWDEKEKRYYLLNYILPSEDLEDVDLLSQNSKSIEDYNFKKTISKYDLQDFIITIIYKNNNKLRVLSKIKLDEKTKIESIVYEDIDFSKEKDIDFVISSLKTNYENHWKNINKINTSIKLPITVSIDSKEYNKITVLENSLNELNFVSDFFITKFNNKNIFFKIIYNGSPDKFIIDMKKKGILLNTKEQIWKIQ